MIAVASENSRSEVQGSRTAPTNARLWTRVKSNRVPHHTVMRHRDVRERFENFIRQGAALLAQQIVEGSKR